MIVVDGPLQLTAPGFQIAVALYLFHSFGLKASVGVVDGQYESALRPLSGWRWRSPRAGCCT